MAATGLHGPFRLDQTSINNQVTHTSPGAYALGRHVGDTFYVDYVGRSDSDLASRLSDWVGNYQYFKFGYFASPKAAFEKECHLFHDFGETALDNKVHPARPAGSGWRCPRCNF